MRHNLISFRCVRYLLRLYQVDSLLALSWSQGPLDFQCVNCLRLCTVADITLYSRTRPETTRNFSYPTSFVSETIVSVSLIKHFCHLHSDFLFVDLSTSSSLPPWLQLASFIQDHISISSYVAAGQEEILVLSWCFASSSLLRWDWPRYTSIDA